MSTQTCSLIFRFALISLFIFSNEKLDAQELFYENDSGNQELFIERAFGDASSPYIFTINGPISWRLEQVVNSERVMVDTAHVSTCCHRFEHSHFTPLKSTSENIWYFKRELDQSAERAYGHFEHISLKKHSASGGLVTLDSIAAFTGRTKTARKVRIQNREFVLDYGKLIETTGNDLKVIQNAFPMEWTWGRGVPFMTKIFELNGRIFLEMTSSAYGLSPGPLYRGSRHFGLVELVGDALELVHRHELAIEIKGQPITTLGNSIFIATDLEMPASGMRRPAILQYSLDSNVIDTLLVETLPEVSGDLVALPAELLGESENQLYFDLNGKYRVTETSIESIEDSQLPGAYNESPTRLLFTDFYGDWKYAYRINKEIDTDGNDWVSESEWILELIREDQDGNRELVVRDELFHFESPVDRFDRPVLAGDAIYFVRGTEDLGFEIWAVKGEQVENVFDLAPGTASSNPIFAEMADDGKLYFVASAADSVRNVWAFDPFISPVDIESNGPKEIVAEMHVFPNPISSGKVLKIDSKLSLEKVAIFDIMGRAVKNLELFGERGAEIDIEGLGAGVYFMIIESEDIPAFKRRFIVQ